MRRINAGLSLITALIVLVITGVMGFAAPTACATTSAAPNSVTATSASSDTASLADAASSDGDDGPSYTGPQSSFEYKQYEDLSMYKDALRSRMYRVYSELGESILDDETMPIPGLITTYTISGGEAVASDRYVPQGLCLADRYLLVTAYNSKKLQRSVIYAVDTELGELVSTLTLPNRYHVGGIAFDGSCIWITGNTSDKYKGDPFVQYIKYEDFQNMIAEPVHEITGKEISDKVTIKNKPSFLECDDGVLWVGTYVGMGSSKKGYMNGYEILEGEDGPRLNTFMYSVITGIDSSAQGADIKGRSLYVSSSYAGAIGGIRSSFVTKYNISPIKRDETSLNVSDREICRVEVPKMNEEILVTDSGVLINFESGAEAYKTAVIPTDRILAVDESLWR